MSTYYTFNLGEKAQSKKNAVQNANEKQLEFRLKFALDFRFTHKPIVRIALEHLLRICVQTIYIFGLYLTLSASVSIL